MKKQDMGIIFKAEESKTKEMIERLETCGLGTKVLFDFLQQIVKECYVNLENGFNHENTSINCIHCSGNDIVYSAAINKLQQFQMDLEYSYENYYKVSIRNKQIQEELKNKPTKKIVQQLSLETIETLTLLQNSSSMDIRCEESLIMNTYYYAYQVMKLELFFFHKSAVLEYLQNSPSLRYIHEQVKQEIEQLDPKEKWRELIYSEKKRLDKKDIVPVYAEPTLLSLLALQNLSIPIENICKEATEYQKKLAFETREKEKRVKQYLVELKPMGYF